MLKKALSYYLSFSLLLAGSAVPLVTHTCHVFEISETSLFVADTCCGAEMGASSSTSLDVNCCSLEINVLSADLSSTFSAASQSIDFTTPFVWLAHKTFRVTSDTQVTLSFTDTSPPASSLSFLRLIQVFRI